MLVKLHRCSTPWKPGRAGAFRKLWTRRSCARVTTPMRYRSVLIATDGSPTAAHAAHLGASLGRARGATVTLAHVGDELMGRIVLKDRAERLGEPDLPGSKSRALAWEINRGRNRPGCGTRCREDADGVTSECSSEPLRVTADGEGDLPPALRQALCATSPSKKSMSSRWSWQTSIRWPSCALVST
jgi:hypothetical protein